MNQKSEDGKYISEVDVTQDGKPERIVIDAEAAGNPKTGEEPFGLGMAIHGVRHCFMTRRWRSGR